MSAMSLPALTPSAPRGEQVAEALQAAILRGDLAPGTRLRIRDVAEQLGTSVMPVRQAMTRLEEAGLVESEPYRGAVVRTFSPVEMLDVYAVRAMLESEAARLGSENADEALAERMRSRYARAHEAVEAGAHVAFLDRDEEFLLELYTAAENAVLVETIRGLWRRCRSFKLFGVRGESSSDATLLLGYQDDLIAAVAQSNGEIAAQVVTASIERATEAIRSELRDSSD